nr:reverse transcriptase domain-containing protein [Tanacetum cinerariifolium]
MATRTTKTPSNHRRRHHSTKAWMNFMVIKSLSPYNGIIGRPGLKAIQAVPSTVHEMLKFTIEGGIVTICSSLLIPAECASIGTSSVTPREERTRPANFTVALHPNFLDQEVVVGGSLSDRGRTELCSLLKKNLDIFAWQPSDMIGVPRSVAEHRLNIREGCPPVRQKKRGQAPKRAKAIQAEVQKLVEARIMREFYYHVWLSNPVMVKKHDGSWRMFVDFTDLNKACPQDCYPLPEIDWKNAGATYQRLMDKAFESQIGRNIEVYVDDLVVKSHIEAEMVRDIEETFRTLRKINMKLNPKKCSFGLTEGVFLGKISAAISDLKKCIKKSDFRWTAEAEQAFQQLKQHLSDLPLLVAPRPQEELIMYLSATHETINADECKSGALCWESITLHTDRGLTQEEPWTLFTDGSSCVDGSSAGLILTNPEGVEFTYALRFQFAASNNEAEYEALVAGLRIVTQMGVKNVQVNVDSKLVANQVLGTYVAKEDNMIKYLEIVKGLVSGFITFSISQVPRSRNKKADALSQIASTSFAHLSKQVLVEVLKTKSITGKEVTTVIEDEGPTWMTELVDYLKEGILSGDEKEAQKLRLKACQYELMEGVLYKRSFLTPWLRCVRPLQAEEIHKGSCSMHVGPWPLPGGAWEGQIPEVAMDYFTKWIEAKAVATITGGQVKKFVWDKIRFASVKHPQSNGLVERANRSLWEGIKARLGEGNKNWVEELPHVLWAHRTMIKSSHGDTPFSLTYGTEAVIPAEIGMPTYRTAVVDVVNNDEELRLNLDLLEERRELAAMSEAKSKSKMMKYYNARVRGVAFQPGDFVYRSNGASHAVAGGKLGPKWEGPYEVTEALGNGAYKLRSTEGTVLPRTWNVTNLKRCYL